MMSDTEIDTERGETPADGPDPIVTPDESSGNPAAVTDDDAPAEATPAPRLTRRGRVRKWDRPPPPKDWRWYVGNVGRTLIAVGILMFAFVGYQLYGTGIEKAVAQNRLEDEFAAQLAQFDPPPPPAADDAAGELITEAPVDPDTDQPTEEATTDQTATSGEDQQADAGAESDEQADASEPVVEQQPDPPAEVVEAVPVEEQNIVEVADGDALARLEIPAIGVNDIVVAGVDKNDLKQGPGHFPDTPLPGQLGNTAIAGHRTTFGQPFRNVDQLAVGDEMRVTTPNGVFVYRVTGQRIVSPEEYQVIATTDPTVATITLVSCHPVFTARERIIIFGELDSSASSPVGEPVINYGREEEPEPLDELPVEEPVDAAAPADETTEATPDETGTDDPDIVESDPEEPASESEPASEAESDDAPASETSDDPADFDELGSAEVNAGIADAFSEGWFSDPAANSQVGLWGAILAAIAAASYAISRRFRRDLVGLAVGLLPFLVALYFFFQNVNRLLPPNL